MTTDQINAFVTFICGYVPENFKGYKIRQPIQDALVAAIPNVIGLATGTTTPAQVLGALIDAGSTALLATGHPVASYILETLKSPILNSLPKILARISIAQVDNSVVTLEPLDWVIYPQV